jgi:hypothetical protein
VLVVRQQEKEKVTNIEPILECCHLLLEHCNNGLSSLLTGWKDDSTGSLCSDVDHFLEFWMLKGLDRLE